MHGDRKPTAARLKKANPRVYAELCEEANCYREAYHFYSQSQEPEDLVHAAELALQSNRRREVRGLCKKAREIANANGTEEEIEPQISKVLDQIL